MHPDYPNILDNIICSSMFLADYVPLVVSIVLVDGIVQFYV